MLFRLKIQLFGGGGGGGNDDNDNDNDIDGVAGAGKSYSSKEDADISRGGREYNDWSKSQSNAVGTSATKEDPNAWDKTISAIANFQVKAEDVAAGLGTLAGGPVGGLVAGGITHYLSPETAYRPFSFLSPEATRIATSNTAVSTGATQSTGAASTTTNTASSPTDYYSRERGSDNSGGVVDGASLTSKTSTPATVATSTVNTEEDTYLALGALPNTRIDRDRQGLGDVVSVFNKASNDYLTIDEELQSSLGGLSGVFGRF